MTSPRSIRWLVGSRIQEPAWLVPAIAAWLERGSLNAQVMQSLAIGWSSSWRSRRGLVAAFVNCAWLRFPHPCERPSWATACSFHFACWSSAMAASPEWQGLLLDLDPLSAALVLFYVRYFPTLACGGTPCDCSPTLLVRRVPLGDTVRPVARQRRSRSLVGENLCPSVTLVFASVSAYAFRSLGRAEARTFYGMPQKA